VGPLAIETMLAITDAVTIVPITATIHPISDTRPARRPLASKKIGLFAILT
jgi:hypothetical protein